jgi:hypothetical protein
MPNDGNLHRLAWAPFGAVTSGRELVQRVRRERAWQEPRGTVNHGDDDTTSYGLSPAIESLAFHPGTLVSR